MTDQLRQAAQQALEVLNTAYFPDIEEGMTAYNALRAALEQPQQTPVWAITPPNASGSTQVIIRWQVETPQGWVGSWDREALEWLTTTCKGRLQVEQPQQEPVAIHQFRRRGCSDWYDGVPNRDKVPHVYEVRTLYTAPQPAREWEVVSFEDNNGAARKRPEDCQRFDANGIPAAVWVGKKRYVPEQPARDDTALLRQALEVLEDSPYMSNKDDYRRLEQTITAIRQHLGETK